MFTHKFKIDFITEHNLNPFSNLNEIENVLLSQSHSFSYIFKLQNGYDCTKKVFYSSLSRNPNITWDIVKANPDKPWNYGMLSGNPNITFDIVKNNPDIKWNYNMLSTNPNITFDIVRDNPDKDWSYYFLSRNSNITFDIVRDNQIFPKGHPKQGQKIPWNYEELSGNPNITLEIIKKNQFFDNGKKIPWNYNCFCILNSNPNTIYDILKDDSNIRWSYYCLSQNPNINWSIMQSNPDKDWNYSLASNVFESKKYNFVDMITCESWNHSLIRENINDIIKQLYFHDLEHPIILYDAIFLKIYNLYKQFINEFHKINLEKNYLCLDVGKIVESYL